MKLVIAFPFLLLVARLRSSSFETLASLAPQDDGFTKNK
jgi:hypothetical protein